MGAELREKLRRRRLLSEAAGEQGLQPASQYALDSARGVGDRGGGAAGGACVECPGCEDAAGKQPLLQDADAPSLEPSVVHLGDRRYSAVVGGCAERHDSEDAAGPRPPLSHDASASAVEAAAAGCDGRRGDEGPAGRMAHLRHAHERPSQRMRALERDDGRRAEQRSARASRAAAAAYVGTVGSDTESNAETSSESGTECGMGGHRSQGASLDEPIEYLMLDLLPLLAARTADRLALGVQTSERRAQHLRSWKKALRCRIETLRRDRQQVLQDRRQQVAGSGGPSGTEVAAKPTKPQGRGSPRSSTSAAQSHRSRWACLGLAFTTLSVPAFAGAGNGMATRCARRARRRRRACCGPVAGAARGAAGSAAAAGGRCWQSKRHWRKQPTFRRETRDRAGAGARTECGARLLGRSAGAPRQGWGRRAHG
uniref:Uncharacterized protein n=1 Tax=Alexandrium monilatum TaxID=311494 RepID=A0A6T0R241_9DINO